MNAFLCDVDVAAGLDGCGREVTQPVYIFAVEVSPDELPGDDDTGEFEQAVMDAIAHSGDEPLRCECIEVSKPRPFERGLFMSQVSIWAS